HGPPRRRARHRLPAGEVRQRRRHLRRRRGNLGVLLPGLHLPRATVQTLKGAAGGPPGCRPTLTGNPRAGAAPPRPLQEGASMILRHAPPARNLGSILKLGLLTARSQGRLPVVWACSPARSSWAVLHTIKRHGGKVESTVVLEVDIPRSWLKRSSRKRV